MSTIQATETKAPANNGTALKGGVEGNGTDLKTGLRKANEALKAKKPPKLQIPTGKRPDVSDLEMLELQIDEAEKQDQEIAAAVGEWMEETSLPYLDRVGKMCDRLGENKVLKMLTSETDDAGNRVTHGQLQSEYAKKNDEFLYASFQIGEEAADGSITTIPAVQIRTAAHMAVLKFRFKEVPDMETLQKLEELCISDGYFVEHSKGEIHIRGKRYSLSSDEKFGCLSKDDERTIGEIVAVLMKPINQRYQQKQQEEADALKKRAEIELEQLLAGQAGKCFMHVPYDHKDGLPEVYLLVRGDGEGKVFIQEAVGPDESQAYAIRDSKIHLNLTHTEVPFPPRTDTMMDKWKFSEQNAHSYQRFWSYVSRAKRVMNTQKRRAEQEAQKAAKEEARKAREAQDAEAVAQARAEAPSLKAEFQAEVTATLQGVLMETPPLEGIFYGEYSGTDWTWTDDSGTHVIPADLLFFQGELKNGEDGQPMLKVRRASEFLKDRFFKEENFEFKPYGTQFKGLGQPFEGIMKMLFNKTRKSLAAS